MNSCSIGINLINEERNKQLLKHGFGPKHDLQYTNRELLKAAYVYLLHVTFPNYARWDEEWPWDDNWLKDDGDIENLKKVAALVAAEIDRRVEYENTIKKGIV